VELGAIFLLLVVLILVALFVAQPFTRYWRVKTHSSTKISSLLAERERVLTALMELDFDNGIGKIPVGEYSSQRANLIQKGSDILRQLDEIQTAQHTSADKPIEQQAGVKIVSLASDEDLEDMISRRRANRQQKTAGFCPKCGKPILQSDQFCSNCGQILNSQ
jgi:hypothetical protein